MIALMSSFLCASARSISKTSSSYSIASSSSSASAVVFDVMAAAINPRPCTSPVQIMLISEIDVHGLESSATIDAADVSRQRTLEVPSFTRSPASRRLEHEATANVVGVMRKNTGKVPMSISRTSRRRIPVVTLVGQSGPPTRMATLGTFKPGLVKRYRMDTSSLFRVDHASNPNLVPEPFADALLLHDDGEKFIAKQMVTAHTHAQTYPLVPPPRFRQWQHPSR